MQAINNKGKTPNITLSWFMWIIAASFYFYEYLNQVTPNILAKPLMVSLSIHEKALGFLGSAYFITYVIRQIPGGILLDFIGTKRSLIFAIIMMVVGNFLFAHMHLYSGVIFARAITGVGSSIALISLLKLSADWFPSHIFPVLSGLALAVGT